jgi:hypothetical protein
MPWISPARLFFPHLPRQCLQHVGRVHNNLIASMVSLFFFDSRCQADILCSRATARNPEWVCWLLVMKDAVHRHSYSFLSAWEASPIPEKGYLSAYPYNPLLIPKLVLLARCHSHHQRVPISLIVGSTRNFRHHG